MFKKVVTLKFWIAYIKDEYDPGMIVFSFDSNDAAKFFIVSALAHTEELDNVMIETEVWRRSDFDTDEEWLDWFKNEEIYSVKDVSDFDLPKKIFPKKWFEATKEILDEVH